MTAPRCGFDRPHEPHTYVTWTGDVMSIAEILAAAPGELAPTLEERHCPGVPEPEAVWCFTHGQRLDECFVSVPRFGACVPDRSFAAAGRIPEPVHSEHPPCVCPACERRRAVVRTGRVPYPGNEESA